MDLLNKKIRASTLLETIVALMLVMMCFSIGMMIYVNVINSDNNRQKLHVHLLLKGIAFKTKTDNSYLDESIESEMLSIKKKVIKYKDTENLNMLTLKAYDKQGKLLEEYKELLIGD